jgi:hypothetical protein
MGILVKILWRFALNFDIDSRVYVP